MFFKLADRAPSSPRSAWRRTAAVLFSALLFPSLALAQQEVVMFTAVDNAQQALLQRIRDEKVRLDVATWYLNDGEIMMAIANKHKSGVPVRVIGDRGAIFEADPNTRAQFEYLANAGVPIKLRYHPTWYPEIVHWKAGIFAGQNTVEFGSANWTTYELAPWSSTDFKDETAMFSSDSTLVRAFMTKFDDMWTDTATFLDWPEAYRLETGQTWKGASPMTIPQGRAEPIYPTNLPEMVWEQGQNLADRMVQEIDRETNSIEIVIYRLSVSRIADALIRRKQAGVNVRVIVEPTQYRNTLYPEYEMTGAMIDRLWLAGIPIKIRLHTGLTHMKTLITSHVAMNGSSNFTAFWQRDHNYFIPASTKPALHQSVRDRFNIMWNDTTNFGPFSPQLPQEPTQVQPANGSFSVATIPKLEWKRARWATSFDVFLGTSPGAMTLAGRVNAVVSETPPETYAFTPTQALQPNTTYYWRVVSRTYATDVRPELVQPSEIWSFTTAASGSGGGSGSGPYTGSPVPLPGTIQAENFDNGGPGVAYADTTSGNSGGVYRSSDVDVEATTDAGGGYNVGWVTTGEWLKYSVSVTTAGTYNLEFRVASSGQGGTFHIESNGVNLTGPISVPNTGGWQTWTTVTKTGVTLPAGAQIWTLVIDTANAGVVGNLNYIRVVAGSGGGTPTDPPPPATTPYSGTPVALPGVVQAEAFDNGDMGQAYQDTTTGNSGGAFRTTNADIEPASDTGGGHNIGWAVAGEWLQYTVSVGTAGTYDLEFRVASSGNGGTFHLEVNGNNVTGALTVPNSGGWQTWTTVRKTGVTLPAGTQKWRLVLDANGASGGVGNFNYIRVATAGGGGTTPPPPTPEIVIYAADIVSANLKGNWARTNDGTAAAGVAIASNNLGAGTVSAPLANPTNYVDVPFTAQAGVRYRLWLRVKAANNDKYNDSVYVQFSGAVDGGGSPRYRIGTTTGLNVNQATCADCPPTGWGWQNRAYWEADTGEIWFATSGAQTLRIQIREDGLAFDQIILSPLRFVDTPPGPPVNDTTIVSKEPMSVAHARNVVTGTLTSYGLLAVNIVLGIYLMPFTMRHLGQAEYGLWMLVASMTVYFQLFDLGYGSGVVRQITAADARGDDAEVNTVLSTFVVVYTGIGAAVLAFTAMLIAFVVPRFDTLTPDQVRTAQSIMGILGARIAIGFPMSVFGAVTTARQRFALTSGIAIAVVVLQGLCTYAVLTAGYGVIPLVAATAGINILSYAAYGLAARRTFPAMRISPARFSGRHVREVTAFSAYMFLIGIAIQVGTHVDTLIVGAYIGTTAVAIYTVAMRLSEYHRQLCGQFSHFLFPLIVRYHTDNDAAALRMTLLEGTRIGVGLATLVALGLIVFGRELVQLWMGPGFEAAVVPLYVLAIAGVVMVAQGPTGTILLGTGRHRMVAAASMAEIALNVGLTIALIGSFGLPGVAIGTAIPFILLNVLVMIPTACRTVAVPLSAFAQTAILPAVAGLIPAAAVGWGLRAAAPATSVPMLFGEAVIVGLVYFAGLWTLGLTRSDRHRYLTSARELISGGVPAPTVATS